MARRRMFSLEVVDTDKFLEMPSSTQSLYFHLGMRADDDGFVSSPKKIAIMVNCSTDDLKMLVSKKYIIPFEDGIIVIKDWKVNNYIQRDRYNPTRYIENKEKLDVNNNVYSLRTECIQTVHKEDTQVRIELGKDRIDKTTINNKYTECIQDKSSSGSSEVNIYTYFQQRGFISISPMMYQEINTLIEIYSLEEVKQAVDIADNNGKHTLSYVRGILERRRAQGEDKNHIGTVMNEIEESIKRGEDPF